ncbi:unnamed protein product [Caenorhabditis auriculariae]|uniref:Uncharacterized protein n=1 Tax=Caenorhabditis auriculariae TaxID=2777116 RepID=A0A8S1HKF0_9PELO|nr:unnamed protein product [Caenorhabditis auriculariae]
MYAISFLLSIGCVAAWPFFNSETTPDYEGQFDATGRPIIVGGNFGPFTGQPFTGRPPFGFSRSPFHVGFGGNQEHNQGFPGFGGQQGNGQRPEGFPGFGGPREGQGNGQQGFPGFGGQQQGQGNGQQGFPDFGHHEGQGNGQGPFDGVPTTTESSWFSNIFGKK